MPSKIVNIEKHREANRKWWKSNYKKKSFIKTNYERFMEKVQFIPECGCWIFLGPGNRGYAMFSYHGLKKLAHRVSWEFHNGYIPDRKLVLHKCDVRCCVNPSHLYCGTHSNNSIDAIKRNPNFGLGLKERWNKHYKSVGNMNKDLLLNRKSLA